MPRAAAPRGRPALRDRHAPGHHARGAPARASPTATPTARPSATARPSPGSGALAIPPAWTDVWICPWPNGHLQATGRDARGRKQYRYHARWHERRGTRQVRADARVRRGAARGSGGAATRTSRARGLPREKVLAAVVRLLELTLIRVGNDEYARLNRSFGLTTLRDRHARIEGVARPVPVPRQVRPARTRSGSATGASPASSAAARSCPARSSSSTSTRTARSATSRRTTSTTTCARRPAATSRPRTSGRGPGRSSPIGRSARSSPAIGERAAKRNVVEAIRQTADQLGNTPAVARGSYVHPAVLEAYLEGSIRGALVEAAEEQSTPPTARDAGRGGGGPGAPAPAARGRRRAVDATGGGATPSRRRPGAAAVRRRLGQAADS